MIVAIDSFDSPHSGCTTLTATLLMKEFHELGFELLDYPRLVRLNPSVPWKTRGNAAVAFEVKASAEEAFEVAKSFLKDSPKVGALVVTEKPLGIYEEVIERVVDWRDVKELVEREALWWGDPKALPGAVAAASAEGLSTFELLAYRCPENLGKKRKCKFSPLYEALLEASWPLLHESFPEAVCPRGPDPVLLGIRGTHPPLMWALLGLFEGEPFALATVFKTNQHSYRPRLPPSTYPYDFTKVEVVTRAEVVGEDVRLGEHLLYKETGLTKIFKVMMGWRNLLEGELDLLVKPGVKEVAAMTVRKLVFWKYRSPRCPKCGGAMVSAGRGLKRRCKKCGYEEERPRRIALSWLEDQELFPVEGRKLHLEGNYSGKWSHKPRFFCEKPSWECAVAHGFCHH